MGVSGRKFLSYNGFMDIHIKKSHIRTAILMGIALACWNRRIIKFRFNMYREWAGEILLGIKEGDDYDEGYEDGFDDGLMERHAHTHQAQEECAD